MPNDNDGIRTDKYIEQFGLTHLKNMNFFPGMNSCVIYEDLPLLYSSECDDPSQYEVFLRSNIHPSLSGYIGFRYGELFDHIKFIPKDTLVLPPVYDIYWSGGEGIYYGYNVAENHWTKFSIVNKDTWGITSKQCLLRREH